MRIYSTFFGNFPIRFVRLENFDQPFLLYREFSSAARDCMVGLDDPMKQRMLDMAAKMFDAGQDMRRAEIDGVNEPLINVYNAIQMASTVSDLTDVDSAALRESAFRIKALFIWLIKVNGAAMHTLGYGDWDFLYHMKNRLDKTNPAFEIAVSYSPDNNIWIGVNDELPVATEAATYDALVDRVWQIAPEMAVLNGIRESEDAVRLRFRMSEESIAKAL